MGGRSPDARSTRAFGVPPTAPASGRDHPLCLSALAQSPEVVIWGDMITDEYLLAVVPPAMERARHGPEAWEEARRELVERFEALETARAHYRACVIAHYIGFLSVNEPEEQLRWNQVALGHADRADPNEVASFMPSLYGSVGAALRARGEHHDALGWYERAAAHLDALEPGPYADKLRTQIHDSIAALRDGR